MPPRKGNKEEARLKRIHRAKAAKLGLCACCCKREAVPGRRSCEVCLASYRTYYWKRKRAGICVKCKSRNLTPKEIHCQACLRAMVEKGKAIRQARAEDRRCYDCGKEIELYREGSPKCEKCHTEALRRDQKAKIKKKQVRIRSSG